MFVRLLIVAVSVGAVLAQDLTPSPDSTVAPVVAVDTPVAAVETPAVAPVAAVEAVVAPAPVVAAPLTEVGAEALADFQTCPFFQPSQTGTSPGRSPYEMLTAQSKLDYIWSELLANQFTDRTNDPQRLFGESVQPTVGHFSDFMPANRVKVTHSSGVVCKIKLEMNKNSPYTGILRTGSDTGILRWSSTVDPSIVRGPVASFGVKFFKDGELSANGVALNSQVVQTTSNPFAMPLTNQFVAAPLSTQQKFGTVTGYPNFTGNSNLAYENPTNTSSKINFPWQLIWVPSPDMQKLFPEQWRYSNNAEFYSQFLSPQFKMPSGNPVLYHLHAVDRPGDMSVYIGDLRMKSSFFRSEFGDKVLFFKHTVTEEDVQFRREFGIMCPPGRYKGCSPCPQTYNCYSDNADWVSQIDTKSPYSDIYNPRNFATNADSSKIIEDIFNIGTDAFIQKYGLNNGSTETVELPPATESSSVSDTPAEAVAAPTTEAVASEEPVVATPAPAAETEAVEAVEETAETEADVAEQPEEDAEQDEETDAPDA